MKHIIKCILLLVSSLLLSNCGSAGIKPIDVDSVEVDEISEEQSIEFKAASDVVYQETGNWDPEFSKLDVYYSNKVATKGIIIYVHGGSWQKGDKTSYPELNQFCQYFIKKGYIVASINYRLLLNQKAPGATYQDQANDIASAVKFMISKSTDYNSINNKVILFGHSSGAHMVTLVTTDTKYLANQGLKLDSIKAVISSDVHAYFVPWAIEEMVGTRFEVNIPSLRQMFGNTTEQQLLASPGHHINENKKIPPMLLISAGYGSPGASYNGITDRAQELFLNKLKFFGNKAWHHHYEQDTHADMMIGFGQENDPQTKDVSEFLEQL